MSKADEELMKLATQDVSEEPKAEIKEPADPAPEPGEPLELGTDETPEAKPEDIEADKEKKTRSQRWEKRVDNLTARLRAAEQEAAELRARTAPANDPQGEQAPDPNKYEFGEADPQFIREYASFAAREALREERAKSAESDAKNAQLNALQARLMEGSAKVEKTGAEKYSDFQEKISEAIAERGGEPLPPLVSIGIAVSPAGADIAYRLATDESAADHIEKLAKTSPQQAAVAFGELEGEYVDEDSDLNLADPMDMLRMLGRMKSRLAGKKAGTVERKTSKAPEPPENRSRGAGGKFDVGDDTDDFAAFERKYVSK